MKLPARPLSIRRIARDGRPIDLSEIVNNWKKILSKKVSNKKNIYL